MEYIIFDIETDGLDATKIYCMSYRTSKSDIVYTTTNTKQIPRIINSFPFCIGHNIVRYDIPTIERLTGTKIVSKPLDTLAMSWYLFPHLSQHNLEYWGKMLKIKKVEIEDWENLSIEDYIKRCEVDVLINTKLWKGFYSNLIDLYENSESKMINLLLYFSFKLDCLREQEEFKIKLDKELTEKHLQTLEEQFKEKTKLLSGGMPQDLGKVLKTAPKVFYRADGNLSSNALKWIEYLKENNLPLSIKEIREEPNPGSHSQLKTWLERLDWKPITFKESKATKEKIPQVSLPFGGGICPSVKDLYEKEPILQELEGYYQIKHRIGILKGYLKYVDKNNCVYSTANGFTKTHRLQHSSPIVNLPKPGVFFGKECREVLTVPSEDYLMIGSDVSGLEDNTKRHWLYYFDPEYVKEQMAEGFDAHLDIGVLAGLISKEEVSFYQNPPENLSEEDIKRLKAIKNLRSVAKSANFASTYGAGIPKIAETAKISLEDASNLYNTYWKRNWAIKEVEKAVTVKRVNNKMWLKNPLSNFWLFLEVEKDKFSALNQNSGVFVVDNWIKKVRNKLHKLDIGISLQYHDEIMLIFPKEHENTVKTVLTESMQEVNKDLKLNVKIKISIDVGKNYAEVH
ncbi:MAG: hypothetical protein E6R13_10150 [Spirochaetes bacterium]|nr:MAG: hypothetical protein E6R13_10150 [Spirochaetota bacterium]